MAEEIKNAICGFCPTHCRVAVRVEDGRFLSVVPQKKGDRLEATVAGCPRAFVAPEFYYHPDRINYPLKRVGERGANKWKRIAWGQALDEIADKLKEVKSKYGAESLVVTTTGEGNCAEEYRARFQNLFGSPNFTSSMMICSGTAWNVEYMMSGYITYWARMSRQTRCLMLLGSNPAHTSSFYWRNILEAKRDGLKLIVTDCRRTDTAMAADLWLQPKPGTDTALILAMINTIIAENLYDKDFVDKWCYGFDMLAERVKDYPPSKVAEMTWVPADKIIEAARMYATSKPAFIWHGMGIEQIADCTRAIQARYILTAITGNVDIPGGEPLLVPHPKAITSGDISLLNMMPDGQKKKILGQQFPVCSYSTVRKLQENMKTVRGGKPLADYWLTAAHPPSVFRAMLTGEPYPCKAMITEGENPLLTLANTKLQYEAMKKLDLHVAMDVFMTPSCLLADYVLPAASWLEKPMLMGGEYDPLVQGGEAAITPEYERKPEYYLWRELGLRLEQKEYWPWKTLEESYDYRLGPLGVTFKEFIKQGGRDYPRQDDKKYEKLGFGTNTGKFELCCTFLEDLGYDPLPTYERPPEITLKPPASILEYPLILTTGGKVPRYYHSQGRQMQSYRKKHPDPIAQLNPVKAAELGIKDGDWLLIETPIGKSKFKCRYFDGIAPRVVHAEHGWWFPEEPAEEPSLHGLWRSNINVVLDDTPELCEPMSGAWALKGVMCRVYKATS